MTYRISKHLVDAQVLITTDDGQENIVEIKGIPCYWSWEDSTRTAAELWAVIDYVSDNFTFSTFSVLSFTSTKGVF
jgi:hypothetical protein